jgi:sugar lactone lactonase YvrE
MSTILASLALLLAAPASHTSPVEVIESYDASLGQLPEGVAVGPDGDVYVTLAATGELRRIDPDTGVGQTVASFDVGQGFLLGMAFDGDDLYVVLASFVDDTSGVWRVHDDGITERVVAFPGTAFPNDITFDADGNMFVTESIGGAVYRVAAGTSTPVSWAQDPLLVGDVNVSPVPFPIGANGIVYDDETQTVLVANSQVPAIVEIDDDGGEAGSIAVVAAGEHLRGADGLALGKSGDVYVVANFNSAVLRVDRETGAATTLADADDGLVFPATIAFGRGGNDKKSVYVTNFGFGAGPTAPVSLLRLAVGEKGERLPAGT